MDQISARFQNDQIHVGGEWKTLTGSGTSDTAVNRICWLSTHATKKRSSSSAPHWLHARHLHWTPAWPCNTSGHVVLDEIPNEIIPVFFIIRRFIAVSEKSPVLSCGEKIPDHWKSRGVDHGCCTKLPVRQSIGFSQTALRNIDEVKLNDVTFLPLIELNPSD